MAGAASQPFKIQPLCPLIAHNMQYNFTIYNEIEKTVLWRYLNEHPTSLWLLFSNNDKTC
jgi:hypothetical protein